MIYDRLKMIEETQHERPSQDFVNFQAKLLKEMQDQVGIPDEFMMAMEHLADLKEWEARELYLDHTLQELERQNFRRLMLQRKRNRIARLLFVIGLLLGVALVALLR